MFRQVDDTLQKLVASRRIRVYGVASMAARCREFTVSNVDLSWDILKKYELLRARVQYMKQHFDEAVLIGFDQVNSDFEKQYKAQPIRTVHTGSTQLLSILKEMSHIVDGDMLSAVKLRPCDWAKISAARVAVASDAQKSTVYASSVIKYALSMFRLLCERLISSEPRIVELEKIAHLVYADGVAEAARHRAALKQLCKDHHKRSYEALREEWDCLDKSIRPRPSAEDEKHKESNKS